jgi:hypothetical protein
MDDNPYKPPEGESQIQKPTTKTRNRYFDALVFGLGALGGVGLSQNVLLQILEVPLNMKIADRLSVLPVFRVTPIAVGLTMAWWIGRRPESRRARIVAVLLLVSPIAMFAISIAMKLLAFKFRT